MQEVAEGIYRLGAKLVNWYIVIDGGKLTIVDAGNPNQYNQLPQALSELGKPFDSVEAIVLTHGHGDHLGSSAQIKKETGAAVHVHQADVGLVTGEQEREFERHWAWDLYHLQAWKTAAFFVGGGVLSAQPVHELSEFSDGEVLDVPGRPRVIHTPGHTDGSTCILLDERDVILTGDSLVTLHLGNGRTGARVMPRAFNKNSVQALESLDHLHGIEAATVLPGHGEPWVGGLASAVVEAQKTGPS
jgi:glyoxylase-like metal-dependent hydrolase (beta-lactamase superfamily II)